MIRDRVKNNWKSLLIHYWCCIVTVLLWIVHWYEKWSYPHYCVNMSNWIGFETRLEQVLCELRKDMTLKYHFERHFASHKEYFDLRTYHTPQYFYYRGSCPDERQHVCIIKSDMYHYTRYCISLHSTSLSIMNLWVPFSGTCDWWTGSHVLLICNYWTIIIELCAM